MTGHSRTPIESILWGLGCLPQLLRESSTLGFETPLLFAPSLWERHPLPLASFMIGYSQTTIICILSGLGSLPQVLWKNKAALDFGQVPFTVHVQPLHPTSPPNIPKKLLRKPALFYQLLLTIAVSQTPMLTVASCTRWWASTAAQFLSKGKVILFCSVLV